jgi:hypothetical protein
MKRLMVRYKVKAAQAAKNEGYIARVFQQLEREKPGGVRYASFKLEDGVTFVHIVSIERADGGSPLPELAAFRAFIDGINERCEELPVTAELKEIGSYGFFGA